MLRRLSGCALSGALLSAALIAGCDEGPQPPTAPGPAATTGLEITGPRTVAPGGNGRFTATARLSDGTTRDVTVQAQWRSNSVILAVESPGLVTAREKGTAMLSASLASFTSTREVILVPDGTYRLTGVVVDPGRPGGPVNSARVEVTDGPARGLGTYTGVDGRYALHGVAGDTNLRVTREGYHPRTEHLVVTDHQSLDLDLPILAPLPDLSGSYRLTVAAADTCGATLPAEAMSRTYSAVLSQVGPELTVALSGATFATINGWTPNGFRGTVEPTRVRIGLGSLGCYGYYYGCGPSMLERLTPATFIMPSGSVTLGISPTVLAGELDGTIEIHEPAAGPSLFRRTLACPSYRHQFTLSR